MPTEIVVLNVIDGVKGIAVGKYAERENFFDIPNGWGSNIALLSYPVGAIYITKRHIARHFVWRNLDIHRRRKVSVGGRGTAIQLGQRAEKPHTR